MNKPKGTYDLFGEAAKLHQAVYLVLKKNAEAVGCAYLETPVFEDSKLFHRANETADMVKKETYDFKDKGDRAITLRPEMTAPAARAYIENKLYATKQTKYYYFGKAYRYERPQKGRFREFFQFGVENFTPKSVVADTEVFILISQILSDLKIKNYKIHLNCLGGEKTKKTYADALKAYFSPNLDKLCTDCQTRVHENTLRVLDCKVCANSDLFLKTPKVYDILPEDEKKYFDQIIQNLSKLKINAEVNHKLVRGIDYYTGLVFEVKAEFADLGNAATICGGGRYDNLVDELGGPQTGALGFAFGFERLLEVASLSGFLAKETGPDFFIINACTDSFYALSILKELRTLGYSGQISYENKKISALLKQAYLTNPKYILTIGEQERDTESIFCQNAESKETVIFDSNKLAKFAKENIHESKN